MKNIPMRNVSVEVLQEMIGCEGSKRAHKQFGYKHKANLVINIFSDIDGQDMDGFFPNGAILYKLPLVILENFISAR